MSDKKRYLNDLRVIDLRSELEKRNLDKSGVRCVLIERLSKRLVEDGHDPATYKFDLSMPEGKTPSKRTRHAENSIEQETEETPAMEDMIVQDDAGEEEDVEPEAKQPKLSNSEEKTESKMEVENKDKVSRKRELKEEPEATEPKKQCLDKEEKNEDENKLENNTDAEDSINLDIGDDELLNEETDNTSKTEKKAMRVKNKRMKQKKKKKRNLTLRKRRKKMRAKKGVPVIYGSVVCLGTPEQKT